MESVFLIQYFYALGPEYPTYQTINDKSCFACSLEQAEMFIHDFIKKSSPMDKDYTLFFMVEEFPCGDFYRFWYPRNQRFYDNAGVLFDGRNFQGNDVKVKDRRFEVGEIVEVVEGNSVYIGILIHRKETNKDYHIVVGVDDVYYVNYTILKPRKEVPCDIYKKLQHNVDVYLKAEEEAENENDVKEMYLSYCHCYKGEIECPIYDDDLYAYVWQAEKAIYSYPSKLLVKHTPFSHDREIIKYFLRYLPHTKKIPIGDRFISQMAKSKKSELTMVLHGFRPKNIK